MPRVNCFIGVTVSPVVFLEVLKRARLLQVEMNLLCCLTFILSLYDPF
ncbi:hypothetical protein [Rufibacter sp. XAAS-G3-1]|nr:hypothetical protein [Rufibacter sp. XAAS-G3-1]